MLLDSGMSLSGVEGLGPEDLHSLALGKDMEETEDMGDHADRTWAKMADRCSEHGKQMLEEKDSVWTAAGRIQTVLQLSRLGCRCAKAARRGKVEHSADAYPSAEAIFKVLKRHQPQSSGHYCSKNKQNSGGLGDH